MGESREAATEIGVIMMGRPVQNNHRHSVIAVTFRGSRPRVAIGMAGPLAPALRRHRNLRRSGGYALPPRSYLPTVALMLLEAVRGEPNMAGL